PTTAITFLLLIATFFLPHRRSHRGSGCVNFRFADSGSRSLGDSSGCLEEFNTQATTMRTGSKFIGYSVPKLNVSDPLASGRVHDRLDLVVISEGNSAESRLTLDLTPTLGGQQCRSFIAVVRIML